MSGSPPRPNHQPLQLQQQQQQQRGSTRRQHRSGLVKRLIGSILALILLGFGYAIYQASDTILSSNSDIDNVAITDHLTIHRARAEFTNPTEPQRTSETTTQTKTKDWSNVVPITLTTTTTDRRRVVSVVTDSQRR
jgi:hypothetical protein